MPCSRVDNRKALESPSKTHSNISLWGQGLKIQSGQKKKPFGEFSAVWKETETQNKDDFCRN